MATTVTVGASGADFTTISAAVAAISAGDTIIVQDGLYEENVVITKSLTLEAATSRGATIRGVQAGSELGAVELAAGLTGVTIRGFVIEGINGNGAIEKAAVYMKGAQTGHLIEDNEIVAKGDAGLQSEFAGALTDITIDGNEFSGQTFDGPQPGGVGFATQFNVDNDVPRQLVVLGNGGTAPQASSGIVFTNNTISGTTGGISSDDNVSEQGNTMVTIDAQDSLIEGNLFTGTTARFATALRARGPNTDIVDNSFDNSTGGDTRGVSTQNGGPDASYTGNQFIGGEDGDLFFGTPGADAMTTAGGADTLNGGAGNDTLTGGGDKDTAVYAGARADYTLATTANAAGFVTAFTGVTDDVAAGLDEGSDALDGVEALFFSNNTATTADELVLDLTQPVQVFDADDRLIGTFATIQAGVNAAPVNGTVRVAAGTFQEQVTVSGKTGLTITGAGADTVILLSATPAASLGATANVLVTASTGIVIENLKVDGDGRAASVNGYGIHFVNASATLEGLTITGVTQTPLSGAQTGRAIRIDNNDGASRTVAITDSVFSDFQKTAIDARGPGLTISITGNSVTGSGFLAGPNAIAQNGITVVGNGSGAGPTGVISGNTVSGIGFERGDFTTAGILLFGVGDGMVVDGNTIIGVSQDSNSTGVNVFGGDNVVVTNNQIERVLIGVVVEDGSGSGADAPTISGNSFADMIASFTPLIGGDEPNGSDPDAPVDGRNILYDGAASAAPASVDGSDGTDEFAGGSAADVFDGLGGNDILGGGGGDDTLTGGGGSDSISGGAGVDTAAYVGARSDFTIAFSAGSLTVTDDDAVAGGDEGVDTLSGVERLDFAGESVLVVGGGGFATIQAAVDAATAGDTILIAAGTYAESVSITKALTFVGAGAGLTIVTPPSGSGFSISGAIGAAETIAISGISFTGSPNGSGVAFADTAVLGALEIRDSAFTGNFRNGLAVGGGSGPVPLGAVVVEDSVFTGNGGNPTSQTSAGDGDLLFFQYNGDATLRNLTITGEVVGSGPAENGIQFRGDTGSLGTVLIENVTIAGVYEKSPIAFFDYDDVTGLATTNVTITADSTSFANAGNFDGVGGNFGTGGIDATGAPDPFVLQGDASSQQIDGGAENNVLRGGAGNDTLNGGDGFDVAVYAGARAEYTLATTANAAGFVTAFTGVTDDVAAGLDEGADALDGVEALLFRSNTSTPADDILLDLTRPVQVFDADDRLIGTFATIQAGVNAAPVDGVVRVAAGTYAEAVTVSTAGLSILGANVGVIAHAGGAANPDRAAEATVTGGFHIGADGVTVDGFEIAGGTEAVRAVSGGQSIDDLTISNLLIRDTTDSPIRFGLGFGGGLDSQNWTITGNLIDGIAGSGRTGMVLFNVDGLAVSDNVILHDDAAFTGRRGINADGVRNAAITGNQISLGLSQFIDETLAQNEAPWAIQVGLSDRDVENVRIDGNTLQGARFGVVGLSQRSLSGLEVTGNTISDVINGVALNAGGVAPVVADPVQGGIVIEGNAIDASLFAVRLRDLHDATVNGPVVFENVEIGPNAITSGTVQLGETNPAAGDRVNIAGSISVIGSDTAGLFKVEGDRELTIVGGADNDTVLGGAGDDTATGGGGDDSIDGGGGEDVAVYAGAFADFAITRNGALTVADLAPAVDGDEGADTLNAVETLRFDDQDRRVFFAGDDAGIGVEGLPTFIDILANDGDSNGDGAATAADVALAPNSARLLDADDASGKVKTVAGEGVWTLAPIGPGGRDVLIFQPETNFFGEPGPVFYTVAGVDGVLSLAARVTVDIENVNDAPEVTAPATATLAEDATLAFGGLQAVSVLDVDDDALIATLSVSEGVLTVSTSGSATVDGDGTALVTISGTQAEINAALAGLVYAPDDDYFGSDALSISVSDGVLSDDAEVAITVTPVNDAPVNTVPVGPLATDEDTPISFAGAVSVFDVEDNALRTTLTVTRGALTVATGGVATVTGNGTQTVTVAGSQTAINAALASLSYAPGADLFGPDTLTVSTTDFALTDVDVVDITVNAVNDAPTVTTVSAPNITAAGGASTTVTVTYADIDGVINVGSLGVGDIVVTGPGGPLLVTGLSVSPAGNGTPRTVNYVVAAPDGAWDEADEGGYTVSLIANEVFDAEGLPVAANAVLTSFAVAIPDTPPPATFRVQAEAFTLAGGFVVQARSAASGGANIETRGTTVGTATLAFSGEDGLYDIDLGYFDENDGVAALQVLVNGVQIDNFLWNANTGFSTAVAGALVERRIEGIALREGDVVTLVGAGAPGEPTRTDYLDFTRIGDLPPPPVQTFRVEAEDFALSGGFVIRTRSVASDGANIEVTGPGVTGTATLAFTGGDGLYDIDVGYFDENDGIASLRVLVNGDEIDSFLWNADTGFSTAAGGARVERRIDDIALREGDVITLIATGAVGEPARTDYLDFTRTGDLPPPPVQTFRVEAEDFTLSGGFVVRTRSAASDGANIEVTGPGVTGTAALAFSGADGLYDIDLGYFDENDGAASLRVLVNGVEIDNFLWDANTGFSTAVPGTLVERRIEDIALSEGDVITLIGTGAVGEPARTDYLDFTRTGDLLV